MLILKQRNKERNKNSVEQEKESIIRVRVG